MGLIKENDFLDVSESILTRRIRDKFLKIYSLLLNFDYYNIEVTSEYASITVSLKYFCFGLSLIESLIAVKKFVHAIDFRIYPVDEKTISVKYLIDKKYYE